MYIRKKLLFYLISKYKLQVLNLAVLILIFCAVFLKTNNMTSEYNQSFLPITNIETQNNIYTVTINLNGAESKENIKMLSNILKETKVEATFFVTNKWLGKNIDLFRIIINDNHSLGLLIDDCAHIESRKDSIEFLANENDIFFQKCSYYPSYVRIISPKKGKIPELLGAFGQNYISSSTIFSENIECITKGEIVEISNISATTSYAVREYILFCTQNGFSPVSLKKLLSEK